MFNICIRKVVVISQNIYENLQLIFMGLGLNYTLMLLAKIWEPVTLWRPSVNVDVEIAAHVNRVSLVVGWGGIHKLWRVSRIRHLKVHLDKIKRINRWMKSHLSPLLGIQQKKGTCMEYNFRAYDLDRFTSHGTGPRSHLEGHPT